MAIVSLGPMNIALWLTLSRFLLLPLALVPIVANWSNGWLIAAGLTALAGFTDVFDGILARKLGQTSSIGANLDLLADKLFVVSSFGLLAWYQVVPAWVPAVIVVREIIISIFRATRDSSPAPVSDSWGKAKTVTSFIAVTGLMLRQDFLAGGALSTLGSWVEVILSLAPVIAGVAVLLTVFSGVNYVLRWGRP